MRFGLLPRAVMQVHLLEGVLTACEFTHAWAMSTVTRKARFVFGDGPRANAMDELASWIAEAPARRSIIWNVGPIEAMYFMLPWSPANIDHAFRDAYARERFEQLYLREASRYQFCFAGPCDGSGQLVSCISNELYAELVMHTERMGCKLAGIEPSIPAEWDRFSDVVQAKERALGVLD